MATSTLDPDLIEDSDRSIGIGHDNKALGYSDSSDSGSDLSGVAASGVDTDSHGTGERASVEPENGRLNRDIDDDDIEAVDGGDDFADTDEDDPALSEEAQIRELNLDIDEIEND